MRRSTKKRLGVVRTRVFVCSWGLVLGWEGVGMEVSFFLSFFVISLQGES